MDKKTYAVVDLETTGHSSAKGDRIIEIAIVLLKNGEVTKRYSRFVNPMQEIPPFIQKLTNITAVEVESAPTFEEIAEEVRSLLEGTVFVAHNTSFDLPFLQQEFRRCGIRPWEGQQIDTVELSKIVFPMFPSYRLQDVAELLGIVLPSAHRATDDAEATANLYVYCVEKLKTLPLKTLELLHAKSFHLKSDLAGLFYAVLKEVRSTNRQDHTAIFRGIPYRLIEQNNRTNWNSLKYPSTDKAKEELLKQVFKPFEKRTSQFQLMDTVWEALQHKQEIAAEAPTGIGKTIGYLLPAVLHAQAEKRPVIISTYTNHLVDKIADSELKKVAELLNTPISFTILKGREQYISLKKFQELLIIRPQSYDELFTMMQILVWLTETTTGDLSELTATGGGQLLIERIRNRSYELTKEELEADYFTKHMAMAKTSTVVLTNHAMLLNDVQRRNKLFAESSGIIVDEAHQLVHTSLSLKKTVFSYTSWKYVLGQLSAMGDEDVLPMMLHLLRKFAVFSVQQPLASAEERLVEHFDKVCELLARYNLPQHQYGTRSSYLLEAYTDNRQHFHLVAKDLSKYLQILTSVTEKLKAFEHEFSKKELAYLAEWQYWVDELAIKASEWVEVFLEVQDEYHAVWVERDERSLPSSLLAVKQSLDSAAIVRELVTVLNQHQIGIVWTSGTLQVGKYDHYIPNLLGFSEHMPVHVFEAPPSFYEGAKLYIVKDMPDIQEVPQSIYIEEVANAIVSATLATSGRLFVLFTSKDMLRKTYELIVDSEQLEEYMLLAQGITSGSRLKLLKSFGQFGQSVLFGTSSFWEGVDIPGDALSAVIVVRLPFTSPEEPIYKARIDQMKKNGENAFDTYALPEAIMRMRQGFGRLIRNSDDRGAFIVLDRRIDTKSYGKQFIEALPEIEVKNVPLLEMVKELESCYNKRM